MAYLSPNERKERERERHERCLCVRVHPETLYTTEWTAVKYVQFSNPLSSHEQWDRGAIFSCFNSHSRVF